MADSYSNQVYDGARNAQFKLTDLSDGTGLTNQNVTNVSSLVPNPGIHLKLRRVRYSIEGMTVRLQWGGTPNKDLILISQGEDVLDFSKDYAGGIPNNAAMPTGDVLLTTIGASANSSFTIMLEFIKGV
jgi:hypothetical protein